MTMWKQCDSVKGLARSDDHLNLQLSVGLYRAFSDFQLIV